MSEFINTRDVLGDQETFDALVDGTLVELKDDAVTSLRTNALRGHPSLEHVSFPNLATLSSNAFEKCLALQSAEFATATQISQYAFGDCLNLESVIASSITTVGQYAFTKTAVRHLNLPNLNSAQSYAFQSMALLSLNLPQLASLSQNVFRDSVLKSASFDSVSSVGSYALACGMLNSVEFMKTVSVSSNAFKDAYCLTELILRGATMSTLSAISAFSNTPISNGHGYIYVPDSLVDTYKAGSNWSTYADRIAPISEYPKAIDYTATIDDSWEEIIAASNDGSCATKYNVGDTVVMDNMIMCLVAKDTDELADNSGTAHMTWLCVGAAYRWPMNNTATTVGGWKDCWLRKVLYSWLLPALPQAIQNNIKSVKKTYVDYSTGSKQTLSVNDTLFIPSGREIFGDSSYEGSGCTYTDYFTSSSTRIKGNGPFNLAPSYWWTRSAYGSSSFVSVNSNGYYIFNSANDSYGVVFGFCI